MKVSITKNAVAVREGSKLASRQKTSSRPAIEILL